MKLKLFRNLLCLSVLALGWGQTASAAVPVTEGFDDFKTGYDSSWNTVLTLPSGWCYNGSASVFSVGGSDKTEYHNARPSVCVADNNTSSYLITPMLKGDFNFWVRNYTSKKAATVTAYTCTVDGDDIKIGSQIDTKTLSTGSSTWNNISFNTSSATRVALRISQAYFDDFTYTPAEAVAGPSLSVKDFANGAQYDFGTVPAGTEYTFNLINQGTEELTITNISVTGDFTITSGKDLTSIESGKTAMVTVATPATDATGELTIQSNDNNNSPYVINLKSTYKVPAPVMEVSPLAIDLGKVKADASGNIVIKNSGDAPLTVTATCDNQAFELSDASLSVAPDSEATLTATFKFEAGSIGANNASITLTPNKGQDVSVTISAKKPDPNAWSEEFDSNSLPEGWELEGSYWTFTDGVAQSKYNSTKAYLTTPSLKVDSADDMLAFQYRTTYSGKVTIKIKMSKDGAEFKDYITITEPSKVSNFKDYTITGLEPGSYRFRFENEDYELDNFEGFKLDLNAPKMELSPMENAVFGKVTAVPEGKVYTISNTGTGSMNVIITSSSEDFSVTPDKIENIEPGEPATFTVNFNYDIKDLGDKESTITVTPSYNDAAAVSFRATATSKDPNIWEEDFEEGKMPQGWSTTGWTVEKTNTYYGNGTYAPYAGYNNDCTLTTPRLYAEKDQELQFWVGAYTGGSDYLTVEYSQDLESWTDIEGSPLNSGGIKSFIAPATGYYYLRFKGRYGCVDNFYGFKLALKDHDLSIAGQTIPANGNQYAEYVASVSVKEMTGNAETATAVLYIDGKEMATATEEIGENQTVTITLSFVPQQSVENAEAYILVTYADTETLKGETVNVTIASAPVWDENGEANHEEVTLPVVVFNYTPVTGWNTISVPFALNDEYLTRIFGESYAIYELDKFEGGIIKFHEAIHNEGKYAAGYPYVVYVDDLSKEPYAIEEESASQPIILENVKIEKTTPQYDERAGVKFSAVFSKQEAQEGETFYELDSTTHSLGATTSMKGYRGYISLSPEITKVPDVKFYNGAGEETGVESIKMEMITVEGIYNLQGEKVKQPVPPGIYIVNGKKMVIR